MKKYTDKEGNIVLAIQFNGWNYPECCDWITGESCMYPSWVHQYDNIKVDTPTGVVLVHWNDWIVKYSALTFNVLSDEEFKSTYTIEE